MPMTAEQLRAQIEAGPRTQAALDQAFSTYTPDQLAAAFPEYGGVEQYTQAAAEAAARNQANTTPNTALNTASAPAPAAAPTNDWMPNQWYNPNVMPENFDWQRYIGANQDLGAAGIDTQEEAMRHYFNYGQQEGRSIGATNPTRAGDLSAEDFRAGLNAYRQATGDDRALVGVGPNGVDDYAPVREWIDKNYIPQGQFKTDYAAAKPADKSDLLNTLETSTRPPEQLANIRKAWDENKDKPSKMRELMEQYGVTLGDLSQATGETYNQLNTWVKGGDILGAVGFSVNRPGAYDKYKKTTTPQYDPNSQFVTGASTKESRLTDFQASQQKAKHTFDPAAYAKDPEAYVKKMREQGGLAALVAEKAVPATPKVTTTTATTDKPFVAGPGTATTTTSAGEGGIKDLVTTTTIPTTPESSVVNPASVPVDTLALAKSLDLPTAPDYSALAGYKPATPESSVVNPVAGPMFTAPVTGPVATPVVNPPPVRVGAPDEGSNLDNNPSGPDPGKNATTATTTAATGKITPANFQSEYNLLKADPNLNEDQMRNFLTTSLQDPTIKAKLGSQLQPALDELNRPPRERMLDQIEKQRGVLGGQYYQGVYSDPSTIARILEDKGVKSLADLGQKEKFQTAFAEANYSPDEMQTTYGRYEIDGNGETTFIPLSGGELATLKDGQYQKKVGNVVINKRTGEELTDTTRQLAYQSSSGGIKQKHNHLVVEFTKDGTPVLVATQEKAGLGAALQDAMPMIAMALPFVLPGIGTALSGALPGAAVAASGATAAIPATLMNTALTQGIMSGGLGALTGQDFGKSFLSGAISPVIGAGIGSLLPAGLSENAVNAIKGAGTGVVKGALQGGDFENLLQQGIIGGATNYGLSEATKGMNLTPQQLSMASSVVSPLLQGQKVDPMKVLSSAITSGAREKLKEAVPGNAGGGLLEGPLPVKVPGNAYGMDPRMLSGIATNMMARSM